MNVLVYLSNCFMLRGTYSSRMKIKIYVVGGGGGGGITLKQDCHSILIQISLKFISKRPIGNKSALPKMRDCDNPLHEPMIT